MYSGNLWNTHVCACANIWVFMYPKQWHLVREVQNKGNHIWNQFYIFSQWSWFTWTCLPWALGSCVTARITWLLLNWSQQRDWTSDTNMSWGIPHDPWCDSWGLAILSAFQANSAIHCHFLCHTGSLASKIATIWCRHQLLQNQLPKKLFLQLPWHFVARATDLWLTNSIKSWGQMQWYSSNWKNVLSTKNISMWHWFHMNAG